MHLKKENSVAQKPLGTVYDGGFYKDVGEFLRKSYLDEGFTKGTVQEVDFLVELLHLSPGARILDVGCGPGRHSLELARRGFGTVGIDISEGFIEYARKVAVAKRLTAEFQVADARSLGFKGDFDAAICLCEGAFGLAGDDAGHRQILAGVSRALKPGATFVLTAINAFSATRNRDPATHIDPYTATSSWRQTFRSPQGEAREFEMHCTAFTYRELRWLLEGAGLEVCAGYGCVAGRFGREPLRLDDVEIMMVARKPMEA
jgi:cyclopropane fatty-acyl-phospholipid synthase-like methyltransferase